MGESIKVVAVLAANPALSSLLTMVLAGSPALRVRRFENRAALLTYMRIAPVDVVVVDFDCEDAPADQVAEILRHDGRVFQRSFSIIALTRTVTEQTKRAAISTGIDEVIVKPMSPRYLLERVLSRLRRNESHVRTANYHGPDRRDRMAVPRLGTYARSGDNVVPLFRPEAPRLH